ncbi:MAG: coproporphyrinogen III oxidase [Spirulinaceae cyanobacterium SM2_1_0]|nr:coproporphyrinogen III oxidase [Spirulinaceae cyanobacterium SM2_1_0]
MKSASLAGLVAPRDPSVQAAYVHIPFCRRRCFYCDFPISVLGDRAHGRTSGSVAEYVVQLCQEITATPVANPQPLTSVFFGGGTPSLLAAEQVATILDTLHRHLAIAPSAEISIEMDPGTFDRAQIQGYRAAGITRVSLGVQAFQDELLQLCGRSHRCADIAPAVELVRAAGIDNLSLDLISGLPQQTSDQWQASLQQAIAIAPAHLSCYDLVLEPVTPFGKQYQPGEQPLPDDETTADFYRQAQATLTDAGWQHYEISNYARSGYQCQHNRTYWQNQPYYGFGMGATSYVHGQRYARPRTRREYYTWVAEFQAAEGQLCAPATPPAEWILETLMLGLRLSEGVALGKFDNETRDRLHATLTPYAQQGWVRLSEPTGQARVWPPLAPLPHDTHLQLSDPEGFLFSNTILAALFADLGVEIGAETGG